MAHYLTKIEADKLYSPIENHATPGAPNNPSDGQIWYDITDHTLKYFEELSRRWHSLAIDPHIHRYFNRFIMPTEPTYNFVLACDSDGEGTWKSFAEVMTTTSGYVGQPPVQVSGLDIRIAGVTTFGTPGQILQINLLSDGMEWTTPSTGTPGGSDGQLQFNNNNVFDGASDLYWNTTSGVLGLGTVSPETIFEVEHTEPYITLHNSTEEDTSGGRSSKLIFKGEQSGGEESTLAVIEACHDGASDDEKGKIRIFTNDGSDENSPTERVKIDSEGTFDVISSKITISGTFGTNGQVLSVNSGATALEWVDQTGGGGTTYSGIDPILVDNTLETISISGISSFGTNGQVMAMTTDGDMEWVPTLSGIDGYGSVGQVLTVSATEDSVEWANISGVSVAGASAPLYNDDGTIVVSGISGYGNYGDVLSIDSSEASMEWAPKNSFAYVTKTSDYTTTTGDMVIGIDASSVTVDITLKTAVGCLGTFYVIKALNIANTARILTTVAQTIDGNASHTFSGQYEVVTVLSDGSNWIII